ncbi:hypothetical protein KIPB_014136, partial [Kipferlia bialata]
KPLLPGDCEVGQLFVTFELLGLPTDQSWPGVTQLPLWKQSFPKFPGTGLESVLGGKLEPAGIDLMKKMLIFDPAKRISVRAALEHPYFAPIRAQLNNPQH